MKGYGGWRTYDRHGSSEEVSSMNSSFVASLISYRGRGSSMVELDVACDDTRGRNDEV
jgi:hypothetical protein